MFIEQQMENQISFPRLWIIFSTLEQVWSGFSIVIVWLSHGSTIVF